MVVQKRAANPRALPRGVQCLTNGHKWRRWPAALADARFAQAVITCVGDSITNGQYSNNSTATDEATFRARGWCPQLRSRFADDWGDPGEGWIVLGSTTVRDPRVTFVGGQQIESTGPYRAGRRLSSPSHTITVTTPACTRIRIHGWWENNTAPAAPIYMVDGGSEITATVPSVADTFYVEEIAGLANVPHTLVIRGPNTKYADISGVSVWTDLDTGVAVHRMARGGGYLTNGFYDTTEPNMSRQIRSTFETTKTDLAVIMFGANESGSGQTLGTHTPATFATSMDRILNTILAMANPPDILVCAGPRRDPSSLGVPPTGPQFTDDDFYDAIRAVALAKARTAFFDLKKMWGSYAEATAAGLMQDVIHPNRRGHSDLSLLIAQAIGGR